METIFNYLKKYIAIIATAIVFGAALGTLSYFEIIDFQMFAGNISGYKMPSSPRVQLMEPNGGQAFSNGETIEFKWEYSKEKYKEMYVTDIWLVPISKVISEGEGTTGEKYMLSNKYTSIGLNNKGNGYSWEVTPDLNGEYHIMAIAKRGEEVKGFDLSDGLIAIN